MKKLSPTMKANWACLWQTQTGGVLTTLATQQRHRTLYHGDWEKFAQMIQSDQPRAKEWIVAIPRQYCILKPLRLPTDNLGEAIRMAEFELTNLTPLPVEQVVYGCWSLGLNEQMLEVMVCILRTSQLEDYLKPMRELGIEPSRIVVSSLALSPHLHTTDLPKSKESAIIAIMDPSYGEVLTWDKETLRVAQSLDLKALEAKQRIRQIGQEIDRQISLIPSEQHNDISILLGGGADDIDSVKDQLNGRVDHQQVGQITLNPEEGFTGLGSYDLLLAKGLADLAVRGAWPSFNLHTRNSLKNRDQKQRRRRLALITSLTLLLVVLLQLGLWGLNWRQQQCCRQIEAKLLPLEKSAGQVEGKQQQIQAVLDQFSNRRHIAALLSDLFQYTPEHISFSQMNYQNQSGEASIRFKGQADSLANAFGYTEIMRQATCLNAIQIENVQQIARAGGSVVEFSGQCKIKGQ